MASASIAPHPLRIPNFRAYWAARLTATLAQSAMMLIIGWQVYNLARAGGMGVGAASAQLGLVGLIQFVPLFALTPVTGVKANKGTNWIRPTRPSWAAAAPVLMPLSRAML